MRGKKRDRSTSPGSLLTWPQQPEIARSKPGSQELLPDYPHWCRGQTVGSSSAACCFLQHISRLLDRGSEASGTVPVYLRQRISMLCHCAGPKSSFHARSVTLFCYHCCHQCTRYLLLYNKPV